ncbi:hypothetical protein GBA52_007687 [Prunus armeniaca]|nr:hypothetical protein GBA52_007687 [Prunus armeniaca]
MVFRTSLPGWELLLWLQFPLSLGLKLTQFSCHGLVEDKTKACDLRDHDDDDDDNV